MAMPVSKLLASVALVSIMLIHSPSGAVAQKGATTDSGDRVVLADDGTWRLDPVQPVDAKPWFRRSVALAPPILSFAAFIISICAFSNTRRSERRRFMDSLMTEYQTPQMHLALETIFNLRDRYASDQCHMKRHYQTTLNRDRKKLWSLPTNKQSEYLMGTLHYHRRVVSHFYQRMHWLIAKQGLKAAEVFDYWDARDTAKLICDVLLPLGVDPESTLRDLVRRAGSKCSKKQV